MARVILKVPRISFLMERDRISIRPVTGLWVPATTSISFWVSRKTRMRWSAGPMVRVLRIPRQVGTKAQVKAGRKDNSRGAWIQTSSSKPSARHKTKQNGNNKASVNNMYQTVPNLNSRHRRQLKSVLFCVFFLRK